MKTIFRKTFFSLLIAMIFTMGLIAQQGPGKGISQTTDCRLKKIIPDLTEDQMTRLKVLRFNHLTSTQAYRNQMGEIRARQRTLMSEQEIDQKAVEKLIDEKTACSNSHLKENLTHQIAISKVLTDEQNLVWNQVKHRRQQFAHHAGTGNSKVGRGRHGPRPGRGYGHHGIAGGQQ